MVFLKNFRMGMPTLAHKWIPPGTELFYLCCRFLYLKSFYLIYVVSCLYRFPKADLLSFYNFHVVFLLYIVCCRFRRLPSLSFSVFHCRLASPRLSFLMPFFLLKS